MKTETPPEPSRRQGRPPVIVQARERILREAARIFAERGYENSSMSELAEAVGASKAAIYHYFQTKQDIFDALIVDTLRLLTDSVLGEVDRTEGADAKLLCFMLVHARVFEENRDCFAAMLIGFSGMGMAYREDAAQLRRNYESRLRAIVAEGVAEGLFRDVDPAMVGRAVLSMLNWMVRWYQPGQGQNAEQIAAGYYDLIVGGLHNPKFPQ